MSDDSSQRIGRVGQELAWATSRMICAGIFGFVVAHLPRLSWVQGVGAVMLMLAYIVGRWSFIGGKAAKRRYTA